MIGSVQERGREGNGASAFAGSAHTGPRKKLRTRNSVNNSMSTEIRPSIKYSSFYEIYFNRVFGNIKNNLSTHMQCETVLQLAPHRRIVLLQ